MNEQQLDQAIANLNRQLTPEQDLWSALERRLDVQAKQQQSPLWLWATAAAIILVGLISWQLVLLPGIEKTPQASINSAEMLLLQVYEQQKAEQLRQATGIADGFDNWQQQLQVWDQAIAQVRHALSFYPDEPQLLAQLQHLYQQQLSFIQKATLQQPIVIS
ncbi:MAG TPA: hypothetical protein VLA40_14215 [Rheinheimera sp.]|nr:hypothetical protein [Rheinheimera sp.]